MTSSIRLDGVSITISRNFSFPSRCAPGMLLLSQSDGPLLNIDEVQNKSPQKCLLASLTCRGGGVGGPPLFSLRSVPIAPSGRSRGASGNLSMRNVTEAWEIGPGRHVFGVNYSVFILCYI